MPDDTNAPVAVCTARPAAGLIAPAFLLHAQLGRPKRLANCRFDRVKLVVACHLLGEPPAAIVLEHDEVAQESEEAPLLERPLDRHLKLGEKHRSQHFLDEDFFGLSFTDDDHLVHRVGLPPNMFIFQSSPSA